MMRTYSIFLLAFLALSFFSCQKDHLPLAEATAETESHQKYLDEAEQRLAEADALAEQDVFVSTREPGILPAGSVDGLAEAIAEVGPFGTVVVESGLHIETGTVMITFPVRIMGEYGAVLQSTTTPSADLPYTADPAIFISNARQVHIEGLHFVPDPATGQGGTGILLYNADRASIRNNEFTAYFQAVVVHASNQVRLFYNRAEGLASEGFEGFNSYGFSAVSGKAAYLRGNHAEDFTAGFFVSGSRGILYKNKGTGGFAGFIYCTYPSDIMTLPDGTPLGADRAATEWLGIRNTGQHAAWGHIVVDGANHCRLINNIAIDCSVYDVEFAGPTERFGFPVPTSSDNFFLSGSDATVKDCGENNTIRGGKLVNNEEDPCF